jgi:hypothetical protein
LTPPALTLKTFLPAVPSWADVRTATFNDSAPHLLASTAPAGLEVFAVTHVRTAHYAVYRVTAMDASEWIVRVGVATDTDNRSVDNSGFLGTSTYSPTGQRRELEVAAGYETAGARVSVPAHHIRTLGLDFLWVPFLEGASDPLNARQWHQAITSLQGYRPEALLPVFTNRAKSFARLDDLPAQMSIRLRNRYDTWLEALFETATSWSVVHGDAHGGNALNIGGEAVLFDFDTACWAPTVWDLTHLLNRAGTHPNTGYTSEELQSLFSFEPVEVQAALELRKVAALIAKEHRHQTSAVSPAA